MYTKTAVTNKAYFDILKTKLAGGFHYNFKTLGEENPRFYTKGEGSRLWDIEGVEYLDFYAKFGAMILGHNNSEFNEALTEQIHKLLCVNHTELDIEVCDLLQYHFPSFERIRFGLSGTEIIQNALRISRAYTGKVKFLRFEGHYHGNMDNIMGGGYLEADPPIPVETLGDPRGTKGRIPHVFEQESYLIPWNDSDKLKETLEKYASDIAAVILEPVLVNGGGIKPKEGYLETVRKLCTQYGVVLIFDEVITGLRFGLSGAQGHYNVQPDLTILGKAIGGGIPVSVLGGKKEIMNLYETREVVHAGTFNGHPLGLAAIKATISILSGTQKEFYKKSEKYTREIKNTIETVALEYGFDISVTVLGSMMVFNACKTPLYQPSDLTFDTVLKNSILFKTLPNYGILISPMTRMFLNTMFEDRDLSFFKERIRPAIKESARLIDNVYNGNLTDM
jgi:glutamate-1-semialdehyde 2,1-aminomutase